MKQAHRKSLEDHRLIKIIYTQSQFIYLHKNLQKGFSLFASCHCSIRLKEMEEIGDASLDFPLTPLTAVRILFRTLKLNRVRI